MESKQDISMFWRQEITYFKIEVFLQLLFLNCSFVDFVSVCFSFSIVIMFLNSSTLLSILIFCETLILTSRQHGSAAKWTVNMFVRGKLALSRSVGSTSSFSKFASSTLKSNTRSYVHLLDKIVKMLLRFWQTFLNTSLCKLGQLARWLGDYIS